MTDEEALKAQVEELIENFNYYLRNYNRLIQIGFRKSVLDAEIELLRWKFSVYLHCCRKGFPTQGVGTIVDYLGTLL